MNRSFGGLSIVSGLAIASAIVSATSQKAEAAPGSPFPSSKATQALEVVRPGRYEVRVFVDGSPITGVRLVDEMDRRSEGAWSTPTVYPAGGLDQVTVLDRQDEPIASFYLHLSPGSLSAPPKEAASQPGGIRTDAATVPTLSKRTLARRRS